jgi:excinuclease ABC subunit A
VIDLGPEGGDKGGELVAAGTPEEVARVPESYTGRYLRPVLGMAEEPEPMRARRSRRREAVAAG